MPWALACDALASTAAIVVAFGSDHGLCGAYNEIVAAEVLRWTKPTPDTRVICIGAQMEDALTGHGIALRPPCCRRQRQKGWGGFRGG